MDEDTEYRSLYIVNESSDAHVTLFLYPRWDFLCWISFESKIIKPNQKYFHRSKNGFKFELVARFEDNQSKRILLGPEQWVEDKLLKITGSVVLTVGRLEDFPVEKTICLQKYQRSKEMKTGTNEKRNLYGILGLNIEKVRKMPKEEQTKAIKKGFQREIQRWHPDRNFGDDEIAKEILAAYEILKDDEKRARYHNEDDFDQGWLSVRRYNAIFKPECYTVEQQTAYRNKMLLFAASLGITVAGIALTACTAGAAAPAVVAAGAVRGSGLTGAGIQSLQYTLNRESVSHEFDSKKWLLKAGIGFVAGGVSGGAAAGITAYVAGLGSTAVESASITAFQYMGIGAGSGGVSGVASSLASDAARKFVDGEQVTWKQALGHAACGAAIGATAGAASGFVSKYIVDNQTSAASVNLEGDIGDQILITAGARNLKNALARNLPPALTENGTEAVMGSVTQFAEERLDDSMENRHPGEHLKDGVKNLALTSVKTLARETSSVLASHAWKSKRTSTKGKPPLELDEDETCTKGKNTQHITNGKRSDSYLPKEDNEQIDLVNWRRHGKSSCSYRPLDKSRPSLDEPGTLGTVFIHSFVRDEIKEHPSVTDPVEPDPVDYFPLPVPSTQRIF